MELTQINPTQAQLAALQKYPKNTPIVMANIIKFRAVTATGNESGIEAYTRYFKNVQPLITKAQASLIWQGKVASTIIGDSEDEPDMMFLVEYPSVTHFLEMIMSPEYQKISIDRRIALEYGGLIACQTVQK